VRNEAMLLAASLMAAMMAAPPLAFSAVDSYDVIIVRGDIPVDYTVASIYAGTMKIPLVLSDPDSIKETIRSELYGFRGRDYSRLLIIGGESAISASVEAELISMGYSVSRLWDWNRYGTAARVAIDLWGDSKEVIITNGEDPSGFLLAQKAALESGAPILFIRNSTIPQETIDAITELGASAAVLVAEDDAASSALSGLGLSVRAVSPGRPEEAQANGPADGTLWNPGVLVILSAMLCVIMLLSLRLRRRPRAPVILNEDEERIVAILKSQGMADQNRLASLTDFSKPRLSRMLKGMEQRGIIERERHKKTYRVKLKHNIA